MVSTVGKMENKLIPRSSSCCFPTWCFFEKITNVKGLCHCTKGRKFVHIFYKNMLKSAFLNVDNWENEIEKINHILILRNVWMKDFLYIFPQVLRTYNHLYLQYVSPFSFRFFLKRLLLIFLSIKLDQISFTKIPQTKTVWNKLNTPTKTGITTLSVLDSYMFINNQL